LASAADLRQEFAEPPLKYATRPLWFWNNTTVTEGGVVEQMQEARDKCGYGGFGILPFGKGFTPKYLSEDYFKVYGVALKKARELGMTMCIYDEYGFPSGSAGAIHGDGVRRFANKHPEHTIKRLDKLEQDVTGPADWSQEIPQGRVMSIVAMDMDSKRRVDLTGMIKDGQVAWRVPEGKWKIMTFVCVVDGDPNVDYLAPEAVAYFVEMTHQQYYNRFTIIFEIKNDRVSDIKVTPIARRGERLTADKSVSWDTWKEDRGASILGVQSLRNILGNILNYEENPDKYINFPTFTTLVYVPGKFSQYMVTKLYLGDYMDEYRQVELVDSSVLKPEHFELVDEFLRGKSDKSYYGYVKVYKINYPEN